MFTYLSGPRKYGLVGRVGGTGGSEEGAGADGEGTGGADIDATQDDCTFAAPVRAVVFLLRRTSRKPVIQLVDEGRDAVRAALRRKYVGVPWLPPLTVINSLVGE